MKCPSFETLSAYIEGELSAEETTIIEKHLSQCQGCQAELEMFGGVDTVLKNFCKYEQRFSTQKEEGCFDTPDFDTSLRDYSIQAATQHKCLSDELLIALVSGMADDLQRKQAQKHLAECSFCLHEVAEINKKLSLAKQAQLPDAPEDLKRQTLDYIMRQEWEAIGQPTEPESPESILSIMIEFIQEGLRLKKPVDDSLRFATSVVRGERDTAPEASSMEMSKDFEEHGISLSMLLEKGRGDRASLALTLTKLKSIEPVTNLVVSIKETQYPAQTTDANGQVRFRNLSKGTYLIELQKNDEAPIASIELTLQ